MTPKRKILLIILAVLVAIALFGWWLLSGNPAKHDLAETSGPDPVLAEPNEETIPTIKTAGPVGWKAGEAPVAAAGLAVTRFADSLDHPRTMLALENGDVLVAETNGPPMKGGGIQGFVMKKMMQRVGAGTPSANRITLLRDADGDGRAESRSVLLANLNSPFGMAVRDGQLLVANTDGVVTVPFTPGQTAITAQPVKLFDLPGGGNHWARNLLLSPDGTKLYASVGSASNIAEGGIEKEKGRAAIWEYDFATKRLRQFAGGLRNPNGMDWNPASGELWTVVNERDMLGSDLVPDYLTNVPFGAQYGWPWIYWKKFLDDRVEAPMPEYTMEYTRRPEYALGAHTAPLGLAFSDPKRPLAANFGLGAFIARHGSWNRKPLAGYDVVFVGFDDRGNVLPAKPVTVLSGFLADGQARGRPVWVQWDRTGALLVSDDVGNAVWRVSGAAPAPTVPPARR